MALAYCAAGDLSLSLLNMCSFGISLGAALLFSVRRLLSRVIGWSALDGVNLTLLDQTSAGQPVAVSIGVEAMRVYFAADVAGYSRLMERDEEDTHATATKALARCHPARGGKP